MRLALSTGGGDAPGLNAVIRAVVLSAHQRGWQTYGIERGFDGLMRPNEAGIIKLDPDRVRGITHLGGTILGTTNRGHFVSKTGPGNRARIEARPMRRGTR